MSCEIAQPQLHAWLDGEARERTGAVQAHVQACSICERRVALLRRARSDLVQHIDPVTHDAEPLRALQAIRRRMEETRHAPLWMRGWTHLAALWHFDRPHASILVCMVVGLLGAAALVRAAIEEVRRGPPAVTVEHLQTPAGSRAHVTQTLTGSTTLIWVEMAPQ